MADKVSMEELDNLESQWISRPSPILCARYADLLRQAGRLDDARKIATDGLKKWKNNISITVVLGRCLRDAGLLEKAVETFEQVHSVHPQNLVALRNLAEISFEKENWTRAVDYYEEYLFEHPGDDQARDRMNQAKGKSTAVQEEEEQQEEEMDIQQSVFPRTDRMKKVLDSQGIEDEGQDEDEKQEEEDPGELDRSEAEKLIEQEETAGSLLEFFSEEEREELHLKPYSDE
ncbi:MAG: tetratricopeptide repeat protein [Candidatus Aegiribacteria sp.]|nr:tetratricopeptide repeat protein [Candidatus Aegiribacteria sp.]